MKASKKKGFKMSKLDKVLSYVFTLLIGIACGYAWAWKALEESLR
jgi:polyferredoxin